MAMTRGLCPLLSRGIPALSVQRGWVQIRRHSSNEAEKVQRLVEKVEKLEKAVEHLGPEIKSIVHYEVGSGLGIGGVVLSLFIYDKVIKPWIDRYV